MLHACQPRLGLRPHVSLLSYAYVTGQLLTVGTSLSSNMKPRPFAYHAQSIYPPSNPNYSVENEWVCLKGVNLRQSTKHYTQIAETPKVFYLSGLNFINWANFNQPYSHW